MTGDYSHNPQLGTLMALLQNYQTLAGHALHEWLEHRDEQERQATAAKEKKRRDRLDKATGHTNPNMCVITPDQVDVDSTFGPTLSTAEAAAMQAELNTISTGEMKPGGDPRHVLAHLAACDFGADGQLLITTLEEALRSDKRRRGESHGDALTGGLPPTLSTTTSITAPAMRRADGTYRANQLTVLAANTPSMFYNMLVQRRDQCWRALSDGYLYSRIFFLKLWIFMLVEVLGMNPMRPWTSEDSEYEDAIMEMFVLFCSLRFVTWGSVTAAKGHVVEFMRSMWGKVPPPFPKTDYTLLKLRKLMATERPEGRRTRTGFTIPEVESMFRTALSWLAAASDATDQRLFINLICACALMYEKAYRGGNVVQRHWNPVANLSRHTIRGVLRPNEEIVAMVESGCEALIFNPPSQKNSNSTSEVARQASTKPAVIDLTSKKPYAMAVLGPLLHKFDGECDDPTQTPAFRDCDGNCITPDAARRFTVEMARAIGIDVEGRGTALHCYRITRRAAYSAGMQLAQYTDIVRQTEAAALNALTGHTSESGAAPYDRDELTAILAADRAAENAVLAPIETLFRFSPDRSKGQSIIVRKNDDGTYSAVTDPADLINHDAETSESDESDAESTDDDPSDDDHQPPAAPRSSITLKPIIVPAPGETEHPADFAAYQAHGTHYQGLDSDQKEDIRRQLRDETIAQQLSQPSQPAEQSSSVTGDVDDDTSRLTWRQEQWQTGGKWWQQTPGPGVDLPRFASTKWLPVVREMVQRRAVAEGRKVSDAHAKRYLSETTLRKSLIVIGAPTAADIVHRYNAEGEADWSAAKAADVHAKLATAKSSAGATSNAFVTAIIGAVMHCDEKLLACHGRATDGTQRGTKRKASRSQHADAERQLPSMFRRTAVDPGTTGGAGIAGDAHIPPSTDDVRLQPAAGGEAPTGDTGADAPHSRREAAGLTDSMTEIEQAVVDALLPATENGQPPFPFPFELGPSMLLSDRSGIRAQWSLTPAGGQTPGTGRRMRTLFQNVRLVSRIGHMEAGRFYCEAWELADGIPPACDFNIVLAADDERDFDYSAVTVAWIEDGFVPDHFSLGVENGRATQPWAWAAGHDAWRPCPPTAQVMARTVNIVKPPGGLQRIFEERRYGRLPVFLDPSITVVPRWLPTTEMLPAPSRGALDHPLDDVFLQSAGPSSPAAAIRHLFQTPVDTRPDFNPMRSSGCLPVPMQQRFLGPCGHPGCRRPAEYVGLNRVCDFCGAHDADCTSFYCDDCWS